MPTRSPKITIIEKRKLWAAPCAICGDAGDVEIDHIVSPLNGGTNERANLQTLCRVCNTIKGRNRTNADVVEWIRCNPADYARRKAQRALNRRLKFTGYY